jgi:hypothetical protein
MFRFTIRDVLWLTVVAAVIAAWWIDRTRLFSEVSKLGAEVKRLAAGPDWAGMDRIMDEYYQHWATLQKRERELGLEPTPNPTEQ